MLSGAANGSTMRNFPVSRLVMTLLHFVRTRPFVYIVGVVISSFQCAAVLAAVSPADYRASLVEIYGRYQGVLAHREACNSAFPQTRASNDKAYSAWQVRHKKFLEELDDRLTMMIRAYSKNDIEYTRNFGKYQGQLLRQREEARDALLQQSRGELEVACKGLPEFFQGVESDLERQFADDLRVVRQWPLSAK